MRTQHSEPRSTNTHGPSSSFRSARSTPVGRRSPILLLHLHLLPSRHDPPRRPRLGTVGQVGRSRNAQTADRRALRLRNPLGGRKSPLSLPPSPSSRPLCQHSHLRITERAICNSTGRVYKQILPPCEGGGGGGGGRRGEADTIDVDADRPPTTAPSGPPPLSL